MSEIEELALLDKALTPVVFKNVYVDLCEGDLIAALVLCRIMWWHFPNGKGLSKLRVKKYGKLWFVRTRQDWWAECRITERQFDRAIKILIQKKFVQVELYKFAGNPTHHFSLNSTPVLQGLKVLSGKTDTLNKPYPDVVLENSEITV